MTAQLPLWVTIPGTLLLIAGGLLTVIGSIGLVRLPDFFARMHGPSLGNTLGAGCVLISSMLIPRPARAAEISATMPGWSTPNSSSRRSTVWRSGGESVLSSAT